MTGGEGKEKIMATIIYFGTDGMPGHYPLGIDGNLSAEEYKKWNEFDIGDWIDHIRENPGYRRVLHYGKVYTNYAVPFSVDDERNYSHTELFWEGEHTEEEIIELIKSNAFLKKQFKM